MATSGTLKDIYIYKVYVIKGNVRPYNPQNKYGFIWHGTSIFGPWQFPLNKGLQSQKHSLQEGLSLFVRCLFVVWLISELNFG